MPFVWGRKPAHFKAAKAEVAGWLQQPASHQHQVRLVPFYPRGAGRRETHGDIWEKHAYKNERQETYGKAAGQEPQEKVQML